MREARIIVANDSHIQSLYDDGWELKAISDGKMYFDREIKKTRAQKKAEQTPQYIMFKELYPKKAGITAQKVINQIQEIVDAKEFDKLIEWVEKYNKKIFLEKVVEKFILNPLTYLNNRRWEDPFSIMENRIPVADKWLIPFLDKLTPEQWERLLKMKSEYKKDITPWVIENMIKKIKWIEI